MSRSKHFISGLLSSYAALGLNIFYTLASVPIALKYLTTDAFGVWILTATIGGYYVLIDLGMGPALARLLIDCKDLRSNGRYGSMIQMSFAVGAVQGIVVLAIGLFAAWKLPAWLGIPSELSRDFSYLLAAQALLVSLGFPLRVFSQILYAWQRIDLTHYAHCASLLSSFSLLWIGFHYGWGLWSLLAANALGWIISVGLNLFFCSFFKMIPKDSEWGKPTWKQFQEMFHYGLDVFLIAIGTQMVGSSQAVMIARTLGVEAAAVWSVSTRAFTLICQLVWRVWTSAMPALAEMSERGEFERLWRRYATLFKSSNALAIGAAILFGTLNDRFVEIWSGGRISWSAENNWLLGLWLIVLNQQGCHNNLIMAFKKIRLLKFVYFLEGAVFIFLSWNVLHKFSFGGMLISSIVCTAFFTLSYGTWRIGQISGLNWRTLLFGWQIRSTIFGGLLLISALAINPLLLMISGFPGLAVAGIIMALLAAFLLWFVGLPRELVEEMKLKFVGKFRSCSGI